MDKKKNFWESDFAVDFVKPFLIWSAMVGGIAALVGITYWAVM